MHDVLIVTNVKSRLMSLVGLCAAFSVLLTALQFAVTPATRAWAAPPAVSWGPADGAALSGSTSVDKAQLLLSDDGTKAISVWRDSNVGNEMYLAVGTVTAGNTRWGAVQGPISVTNQIGTIRAQMTADGSTVVLVWSEQDPITYEGLLWSAAITPDFTARTANIGGSSQLINPSLPVHTLAALGSSDYFDFDMGVDGSGALVATVAWIYMDQTYSSYLYSQSFSIWPPTRFIDATGPQDQIDYLSPGNSTIAPPRIEVSSTGAKAVVAYSKMGDAFTASARTVVAAVAGQITGGRMMPSADWQSVPTVVSANSAPTNSGSDTGLVLSDDGVLATLIFAPDSTSNPLVSRTAAVTYSGTSSSLSLGPTSTAFGATTAQTPISLVGSADGTKVLASWISDQTNDLATAAGKIDASSKTGTWSTQSDFPGPQNTNIAESASIAADGLSATIGWRAGSGANRSASASLGSLDFSAATPVQSWAAASQLSQVGFVSEVLAQLPRGQAGQATAMWTLNGEILTSSTPFSPPPNAPGTPTAVAGDTRATVTVVAPSTGETPTSYTVQAYDTNGAVSGATCTVSSPGVSMSCDVTGLSNGTAYTFKATATGLSGVASAASPASNSVTPSAGPTINTQPSSATVSAGATAAFSVSATAGSGSLTYQWQVRPSGGSWANVATGTGGTSASYTTATLSGSDDQNDYRVVVTDGVGSTTSSTATLTVITTPGAPGTPTAVAGNGQATVTITPPLSGGAPVTYLVTSNPGSQTCTVTAPALSCIVSNLTNGTSYTFTSTATNTAGTSSASSASSAVTPLATPGTPGTPTAVVTSTTSATVTITAPSSGGAPASYLVTSSPGSQTCTVTSPSTSCLVTGLTAGGTYTFTSTATNVGGTSAASAASSSVILSTPNAPGTPTAVSGPGSATVTVVAPSGGGTPTSYTVTSNPAGGSCTVSNPASSMSCVVSSLTSGTPYTFSVTATNGVGTSASSASSTAVTPSAAIAPGTPGTPTAVAGDGQATVTIVAPSSGGAADTYLVTSSPGGLTCTVTSPSTSCTVSGLTNGTAYTFTSTATNSIGTSGASAASSAVTPVAAPGTPGSPSAVVTSTTSATVTITAPSSGGAPATYLVTASGGGGQTCTVTSPATSCVVAGLTVGGTYTFTSTATNGTGTSGASSASSAVILATPGTPGTPTAVAGTGSATVTILAPSSGGTVSSYTVTSVPAGGSCIVTVPATSCVVTGLTAGTSYTFTSTATNGAGTSTSSAASGAVTPTSSGGGGGGGGGSSSSGSSASTSTSTASTSNAVVPLPVPLAAGSGSVMVSGQVITSSTVPVNLSGGSSGNAVAVSAAGVQVTVTGPTVAGAGASTSLTVVGSQPVGLSGSGYAPGTTVMVYLLPLGTPLGSFSANGSGIVTASVSIPAAAPAGAGALQMTGASSSGQLSVSVGTNVVTGLAPVYLGNGSLPSTQPGPQATVVVGGVGQPLKVRAGQGGFVVAASGAAQMAVRPVTASGTPASVSAGGTLVLESGQFVQTMGTACSLPRAWCSGSGLINLALARERQRPSWAWCTRMREANMPRVFRCLRTCHQVPTRCRATPPLRVNVRYRCLSA